MCACVCVCVYACVYVMDFGSMYVCACGKEQEKLKDSRRRKHSDKPMAVTDWIDGGKQ